MIQTTLLFIDDDSDFNTLIEIAFEKNPDWKIITTLNGEDGVSIAQIYQPNVILLDMVMPKLTGIETYYLLKSNWRTSSIPIVFLTAMIGMKAIITSQIDENIEIITKPFNIKKLKDDVIKSCDRFKVEQT